MLITLTRVRPWGGAPVDLTIRDGAFSVLEPGEQADATLDGRGLLALPGLVNTHAHIDKSWVGLPWQSYGGENTTQGRIAHERAHRDEIGMPGAGITGATLEELLRFGTTSIRTHVDVDLGIGLKGLEVVRGVLAERVPGMRYEVVAFPQDGVVRRPGVDKLLRRAAAEGAEHIGGLDPAGIDRDPVTQLDLLFDIAGEHGCGIDIHLHDGGELGAFQFELILERTRALSLAGKVNIAHGFAIADVPERRRAALIEDMAQLDVSLTSVAPVGRPALPGRALLDSGVRVGLGTDGFRDLWGPYGNGDLLQIAANNARMTGMRTDGDLVLSLAQATSHARSFVGGEPAADGCRALAVDDLLALLRATDFAVGAPADLILVDAENPMDALVRHPAREMVMIAGEVIEPRTSGPVPEGARGA